MSRESGLVPLKHQLVRPLTNGALEEWKKWLETRSRYPVKTLELVRSLTDPLHDMQVQNWGEYGDTAILRAVALLTTSHVALSTERYHGNPPLWGHATIGAFANLQAASLLEPVQAVVIIDWRPTKQQVLNDREVGVIRPWMGRKAGLFWGTSQGKFDQVHFVTAFPSLFTAGQESSALVQARPSSLDLAWEFPGLFDAENPDPTQVQAILDLLSKGLGNSCSNGVADAKASKGISAAVICGSRVYRSVNNKSHEKGNCDCAEKFAVQLAVSHGERYVDAIVIYTPHFTMRDGDGKRPAILRVCGACLEVLAQHISRNRQDILVMEFGADIEPRRYWLRERLRDSFTIDELFQSHGREPLKPRHQSKRRKSSR